MTVEVFQDEWELEQLVQCVTAMRPRSIIEVGAMYGGSLRRWLGVLPIGGCAVVVDDTMRRADEWQEWAQEADVDLHLLHGSSQWPGIVATAQSLGPYDFCFIDADHGYDAVLADWQNYGVHAKACAFHDIVERPGYGVSQVWREIKTTPGTRWMEINATVPPEDETRNGIGIVWTGEEGR